MRLITSTLLFAGCAGFALAQMNNTMNDTQFARTAAIGGMTEVKLGQLATTNGSSDKVKTLGQRLADDHKKAGEDLKAIAAKDGMTLPTDLDAKHQALVDKMSKLNGKAFDQAYLQDMTKDHKEDIAMFQKEANSGSNADLKSFATTTLPTLQEHARMVEEARKGSSQQSGN